jgi:hypothetical protein
MSNGSYEYSLNVHWMFTECLLNVHWMFTECSLNVHWMFTECSLNVHRMFTECLLNVHYEYSYVVFVFVHRFLCGSGSWDFPYSEMFTECSRNVHGMFTECPLWILILTVCLCASIFVWIWQLGFLRLGVGGASRTHAISPGAGEYYFDWNYALLSIVREGDPEGRSTVLITALGSWEKHAPRGNEFT